MDEADHEGPNLAGGLTGRFTGDLDELIVRREPTAQGGRIDIVPTSVAMFLVVRELHHGRNAERRLTRLLERLPAGRYDHIIIDCPPSLDILTDNALAAATGLIIPVQPSSTSLRALRLLIEQLAAIEDELQLPPRQLYGLVAGLYRNPLHGLGAHTMAQLEEWGRPENCPILAHLPLTVAVEEAWLSGVPITEYAPKSPIADAYRRIAVRVDVAAGLAPQAEWDQLAAAGPLPVRPSSAAPGARGR
jgi:chromosome partitioning protein